ncbi:MAG: copper amine oxidase N-terminal domain-containing protein [Bacillota bacterium]
MLKRVLILLWMIMMVVPLLPAYAGIALGLDGKLLSAAGPVAIEGKMMVPVRPVFEEMGYTLSANLEEGVVLAQRKESRIEIHLWEPKLVANGKEAVLQAPPQLISGKTYLCEQDLAKLLSLESFRETATDRVSLFSKPRLTREDVIRHLMAADRQMMRAEYYNNQEFLTRHNVVPSPKIVTKGDLANLLGRHWSAELIEDLWQAGSRDNRYVGFFSEGAMPLQYSKEMAVTELTEKGAKAEVKLPRWEDESLENLEERIYTLTLDQAGSLVITDVSVK